MIPAPSIIHAYRIETLLTSAPEKRLGRAMKMLEALRQDGPGQALEVIAAGVEIARVFSLPGDAARTDIIRVHAAHIARDTMIDLKARAPKTEAARRAWHNFALDTFIRTEHVCRFMAIRSTTPGELANLSISMWKRSHEFIFESRAGDKAIGFVHTTLRDLPKMRAERDFADARVVHMGREAVQMLGKLTLMAEARRNKILRAAARGGDACALARLEELGVSVEPKTGQSATACGFQFMQLKTPKTKPELT